MKKWKLFLPVLMLLTCGCEIPDEDRCIDGKVLDKQMGVCVENTATAETDTGTAAGSVANLACNSDADCASNGQVDYCLPNWQDPNGPGTCLQDDCTPGSCELANQTCCDCSTSTIIDFGWPSPLCTADEQLEGETGLRALGCTCTAGTASDTDSNAQDTGTGTAKVGVADVPCYSDADCADNGQVDYCLPDWQNPSGPGTCLQDDCTSGSCEVANHTCCDCPQFGWPSPLCSANELLEGSFGFITMGCTCN